MDCHEEIDDYIRAHIEPEPPELHRIWREAHVFNPYGHMCSGHVQGRLLSLLVSLLRPRRILEIGAYMGYSTLCLAESMPSDAVLDTIEADMEMEGRLRRNLGLSPAYAEGRLRLHVADALQCLPTLVGPYDLALIDADKRQYTAYYEAVLPLMRPGGLILADNTLWAGKVSDPRCHDAQTLGIRAFNDLVAGDPRVTPVIVPLRDGLTLLRVKDYTVS